ncbi:MAG: sulfatase-like hydrolase/transferase [Planctomycetaceae bacterium]
MRRSWRWMALASGLVLLFGSVLAIYFRDSSRNRIDILLVTLDTTRADRIGCYGHRSARTPALDALAERGVLFERAYTPVPLTLPAHSSLFTGLYPPEHGLLINGRGRLGERIPVLAESLRAAGYDTGAFVASFVLDSKFGLERGFDTYDDDLSTSGPAHDSSHRRRSGDQVVESALSWLARRENRPFFCWIHLFDAHAAYDPRPTVFGDAFTDQPYDAGVAFADLQLQKLVDSVERGKRQRPTLIIVAGDHGEGLMDHQEDTHGLQIYDSTMRVPLVFAGLSTIKAGHRVTSPVSLVDIYPTILDCAGIPLRQAVSGQTIKSAFTGASIAERPCVVASEAPLLLEGWAPVHGLVTERWKYIHTIQPELYDLSIDPRESKNVIAEQPREVAELEEILREAKRGMASRDAVGVTLSAQEQRTLESLGYASRPASADASVAEHQLADVKEMMPYHSQLEHAKQLFGQGKLDQTVGIVEQILNQRPQYASARMLLGDAMMMQMNYSEAQTAYETALAQRPDDAFLLSRLGSALAIQDRNEEAVSFYLRALAIDPEFAQCHLDLAQVLLRLGKVAEAHWELKEAIRCDATLIEAHMQMGRLLARTGRGIEAMACYETVLKFHPNHTLARLNLASALSNQGRIGEAVAQAQKACELDPASFDARYHLAAILVQHHRGDEALEAIREALRLRPNDRRARELLEAVVQAKGS